MIFLLHIAIAVSSVAFAGLTLASPSKKKINYSYGLVALTLTSGTWLVVSSGAHILQACITGLIYVSIVIAGIHLAQQKLSHTE